VHDQVVMTQCIETRNNEPLYKQMRRRRRRQRQQQRQQQQ
jgi:hypothetical protein